MKKIRLISIIFIIIVVVFGVVALVLRHVPAETYAVEETDSRTHWGTLSGDVSYPGEVLPYMGICAESVTGGNMFCTYELVYVADSMSGYGYELTVPPDDYQIFSHAVTEGNEDVGYVEGDYQAYYSKFVTCGLDFDCPSHTPIVVTVAQDQYVPDVDPVDWYNY